MRVLRHPLFVCSVLLAAANQVLERQGLYLPLVHAYLDDLLCFPIVLTVGLAGYRLLHSDDHYTLGLWQVWPVVILYAVLFEWVLPSVSTVYTQDAFDVVAYLTGTGVFLRWVNRPGQAPIS